MKLVWSSYENGAVAWFADGEEGAIVGQDFRADDLVQRLEVARKEAVDGDTEAREEIEYLVVEIAAQEWATAKGNVSFVQIVSAGIRLEEAPARVTADYMRTLKGALSRAHDSTPWPDWAVKAQAAGWKPPKGWKP